GRGGERGGPKPCGGKPKCLCHRCYLRVPWTPRRPAAAPTGGSLRSIISERAGRGTASRPLAPSPPAPRDPGDGPASAQQVEDPAVLDHELAPARQRAEAP